MYNRTTARFRIGGRIVLTVVGILFGATLIIATALLAVSPGRPQPIVDGRGKIVPGSIAEKIHVSINGVQQGMFVMGSNVRNPVLLFLHGGTAMPEYFLTEQHPTGLEQYFTVVWWDRRGAGLSNGPDVPVESISLEQFILDTVTVSQYLRKRFRKDKIFLMAHSGGSLIAIQAAARAPELYAAYIGIGQMSNQLKSEKRSYDYMLERYRELGDTQMVRRLEAAPVMEKLPLPTAYMQLRDSAMHGLGIGTMRDMRSVMTGVFLASWLSRQYTVGEKLAMWRGKFSADKLLWDTMLGTDLTKLITKLEVPLYFFHGIHDHTVSYPLAKDYFESVQAPVKGFYTFANSAHSPMFEEPTRVAEIVQQDILMR
jgi:pimeloyl-ACP methyl ester carboxylesterase